MPSQKKIDLLTKLSEKVARAKALVFANYQGLTHKQLEGLKKAVRTVDAELIVTKNTLLKLALQNSNLPFGKKLAQGKQSQISNFDGPTATLFAYSDDIIAPLKELAKIIKLLKLPTVKFAILDNKMLDSEAVLRLATLPSREILIAQVVGQMKMPIYGLHRALSWNIQRLALMLKAIEKTKGGDKNERSEIN